MARVERQTDGGTPRRGPVAFGSEAPVLSDAVAPEIDLAPSEVLAKIAQDAGLRRIHFVAWRDLDDPEAGGSELHAHRIAARWADAGLDVTFRTSAVPNAPRIVWRDGYQVERRSGRYAVFPQTALRGLRAGYQPGDALVEIWNGMPFLSPLWFRGPRIVFLHHVHAEMWRMVLPAGLAKAGELLERRAAPPLYQGSRIVTLSASSKEEIVAQLHLPVDHVTVAPPGVEAGFSPGGQRSADPLVVAVGRLVPVKRFPLLFRALAETKKRTPALRAVIIGEGYDREMLENLRAEMGLQDWVALPGRVDDDELLDWYRRAWLVASASLREGWGMTLTEAAACATPSVATDIAGHRDAVVHGVSGLLTTGRNERDEAHALAQAMTEVLGDKELRTRLGRGAAERARWFNWDTTARTALEALAAQATFTR
jgi:glycosyltransferase involved in cell wall biosynthesis